MFLYKSTLNCRSRVVVHPHAIASFSARAVVDASVQEVRLPSSRWYETRDLCICRLIVSSLALEIHISLRTLLAFMYLLYRSICYENRQLRLIHITVPRLCIFFALRPEAESVFSKAHMGTEPTKNHADTLSWWIDCDELYKNNHY